MRANYASGIGVCKGHLLGGESRAAVPDQVPAARAGRLPSARESATPLLARALDAGLVVHAYALRAETCFLSGGATGSLSQEAIRLFAMGVHGIFVDQPDQGCAARNLYLAG